MSTSPESPPRTPGRATEIPVEEELKQPGSTQKKACKEKKKRQRVAEAQNLESAESRQEKKQRQIDAEVVARDFHNAKDFSIGALTKVLEAADIPWNSNRKNVLPDGTDEVQGMALGLYAFSSNIGLSNSSKDRPWLTRYLASFVHGEQPNFSFTSIQVNKNYAARPHVDKNNLGTSLIIGLGEYEDGNLWVHDDDGDLEFQPAENIGCMYSYREGATYRGRDLNIKNKLVSFDGNRLHFTRPFTGERYSLVFYTIDRFAEVPEEVKKQHAEAGFPFRWDNPELQVSLQEKYEEKKRCQKRLDAERKEKLRAEKEALGHCFARTWCQGWGGDCPHFRPAGPDGKPSSDFCLTHQKTWTTHGRTDGDVPAKKKEEMLKWQKILTKQGKRPPSPLPLGAVILVELAAEDDDSADAEEQDTAGAEVPLKRTRKRTKVKDDAASKQKSLREMMIPKKPEEASPQRQATMEEILKSGPDEKLDAWLKNEGFKVSADEPEDVD
eukprot:TRINITY_DN2841_c3_g3_i1.p1 TRINITY_DN2841_c3_g3~~TRINITY_DN2841_c3_g3_i1.p1  ORF type:complete len:497 (-),score=132.47 TRINITY_DN2841_c3_g3_i1:49-1539(-)